MSAEQEVAELRALLDAMSAARAPASADELDEARMDAAVARAERDEARDQRDASFEDVAALNGDLERAAARAEGHRAWARLWHREARRLWREVQDLNALLSEEHREVMRLRSVIRRYLRTNPPQVEALRDLLFRSADGESIDADREVASARAAALREAADIAGAHGGISAYYAIRQLAAEVEP